MSSKIRQLINSAKISPPSDEPRSFDDEKEVISKKTTKLDNKNSSVKNAAATTLPNIRENVSKILENEDEQKKIAFELSRQYAAMIKDKTLDENKDPIYRENEKNVLVEYINFARLLNSDPNKEDCYGTLAYTQAISRCLLLQRDRINELEYRVVKAEKEMVRLSQQISILQQQIKESKS